MTRNILFIMFDQLRWDYLSCTGHPHLHTPNIDALAAEGVLFPRTYVQSPICGSSRMSTYTGRYVHSHGATWNRVPLKVGERTMGDHLRDQGMSCWLVGKTHMVADDAGMEWLGLDKGSVIGARVEQCGFDIWERDDGMRPEGPGGLYDAKGAAQYNDWLRAKGYNSTNPWHDFANSGRTEDPEELASGWFMKNADKPAAIDEPDSETPYLTTRAMEFIEATEGPWCCHLSYIKPHWPYIAPAPYHDMYGPEHVLPVVRDPGELQDQHPVYKAFTDNRVGQAFAQDEVRERVIPAYMGLIKQCDDQMGRLFQWLKDTGRWDDTVIVLTSDHGDYLGDHWMGEKDLFHDPSVRIPLIIRDPDPACDASRGSVCEALVESIDLAPTFLEMAGGAPRPHILEGRSLCPWLRGETPEWRTHAISEYDCSMNPGVAVLANEVKDPRLFMVVDDHWKFVHAEGLRPMLFDLVNDPQELVDLGASPDHTEVRAMMMERLATWARRPSQRTTMSHDEMRSELHRNMTHGVLLGVWDETAVPPEATTPYRGRVRRTKP